MNASKPNACPFCNIAAIKPVDESRPRDVYACLVGFIVGVTRAAMLHSSGPGVQMLPDGTCEACKTTLAKLVPSGASALGLS